MKCTSCGKNYDFRQTETCPHCGAYNRPPTSGSKEHDPYYAKAPAKKNINNSGLYMLAIIGGFSIAAFGMFAIFASNLFEPKSEPSGVVVEQVPYSSKVQNGAGATVGDLLEDLKQETSSQTQEVEPAVTVSDAFEIPSIPETTFSVPDISVSTPDISVPELPPLENTAKGKMVVRRTYLEELLPVVGVSLTVTATGTIDLPEIQDQLLPGEKAIFISFDAEITDQERFDQEFFIAPYVTVKKETMRQLSAYEAAKNSSELHPLDVDGMRYTDQKTTSGQLIYAIPEDCYYFALRYSEPDGNISMVSLQV